ncbi:MAG: superfamily hydrolase [Deltaproteobacteria bacterium]|nr:superfamily hydrolase [Deltaproteobacteria bacterium]
MNFLLAPRFLWTFDFDGTLSRIVPDRNDARLHPECGRMLRYLLSSPWNRVAVISSRALEDIAPRVPIPGLYVGGGSGLEWRLPGGGRTGPGSSAERLLSANQRAVAPLLSEITAIPGVEVEDKRWSVAIHIRNASPQTFRRRASLLARLRDLPGIKAYRGHDVLEVQLVKGGGKSNGLRRHCRLAGWNPSRDGIVYAGDDEDDTVAMRWVLRKGGTAFCVGDRVHVPGAHHVEGPAALALAVRHLAESVPRWREDRGRTVVA